MINKHFALGFVAGALATAAVVAIKELADYVNSGKAKADVEQAVAGELATVAARFDAATMYNENGDLQEDLRKALARAIWLHVTTHDLSERDSRKHFEFIDEIEDPAVRNVLIGLTKSVIGRHYNDVRADGGVIISIEHFYNALV